MSMEQEEKAQFSQSSMHECASLAVPKHMQHWKVNHIIILLYDDDDAA